MADALVVPEYSEEPADAPPLSADAPPAKPQLLIAGQPAGRVGAGVGLLAIVVLIVVLAAGSDDAPADDNGSSGPRLVTTWGADGNPRMASPGSGACARINPCDSNPCVHGSCAGDDILSVNDLGNEPVCSCSIGWGGSKCDQPLATMVSEATGGGWQLVRRTIGAWHPADDDLLGTAEYGTYSRDPRAASTFSVAFAGMEFDQYLFASGDMSMWAVMDKDQVGDCQDIMSNGGSGQGNGGWNPTIASSSDSRSPTQVLQYCRSYCCDEDPWISVREHPAHIVYGEGGCKIVILSRFACCPSR